MNSYYNPRDPLPPFISPFDDDPLEPNQSADYSYMSDEPVNSRYDPETGIEEFNEPTVVDDAPVSSSYDEATEIEEFGAPYIEEPQQQIPLELRGRTQAPPTPMQQSPAVLFRAPIPPAQQQPPQRQGLRGRTQAPPTPMQQSPAVLFRAPIPPVQQQPTQRQGLDINIHPRYRFPIVGELYDMVFGERGDRTTRLGLKRQKRFEAVPSGDPLVSPQQYDTSRRVPFSSVVSPSVNRR